LDLPLSTHYNEILERVKNGHKLLDLGCCFGQELRQLVSISRPKRFPFPGYLLHGFGSQSDGHFFLQAYEGAPQENLYGADLVIDFMKLGYELFLDKEKLKIEFLTADIFDDNSKLNTELAGKLDIIHASNFFHLWDRIKQVEVAKRVVRLLNPRPGSLLTGSHTGSRPAQTYVVESKNLVLAMHSPKTWRELWNQVSREMGIQFNVEVIEGQYNDQMQYQWPKEDFYRLFYTIRIES
jgi:SAM-dependent methyltransferase